MHHAVQHSERYKLTPHSCYTFPCYDHKQAQPELHTLALIIDEAAVDVCNSVNPDAEMCGGSLE